MTAECKGVRFFWFVALMLQDAQLMRLWTQPVRFLDAAMWRHVFPSESVKFGSVRGSDRSSLTISGLSCSVASIRAVL